MLRPHLAEAPLMNDMQIPTIDILTFRGRKVVLDSDLARAYDVQTKQLNQQVKRNPERFPEDFCFQLTREEAENLRSQFVTSSLAGSYGGRRYLPYVIYGTWCHHGSECLEKPTSGLRKRAYCPYVRSNAGKPDDKCGHFEAACGN